VAYFDASRMAGITLVVILTVDDIAFNSGNDFFFSALLAFTVIHLQILRKKY
jgi:hypothetical protein